MDADAGWTHTTTPVLALIPSLNTTVPSDILAAGPSIAIAIIIISVAVSASRSLTILPLPLDIPCIARPPRASAKPDATIRMSEGDIDTVAAAAAKWRSYSGGDGDGVQRVRGGRGGRGASDRMQWRTRNGGEGSGSGRRDAEGGGRGSSG
jgi:hypothetical protein